MVTLAVLRSEKKLGAFVDQRRFWREIRRELAPKIEPLFRELFLEGSRLGSELALARKALPLDEDAVNAAADLLFATYIDDWWEQFEHTTQDMLRAALNRARLAGTGVEGVIADLEPIFGPTRAARIAATESTRLFGLGAQATYAAAGLDAWEWQTVRDARVDAVCRERQGNVYSIELPFAPRHVQCRCFPRPVVAAGGSRPRRSY